MPLIKGIFDGLGDPKVRASRAANYVHPGVYMGMIEGVSCDSGRAIGDFVVVNVEILGVVADRSTEGAAAQPAGPGLVATPARLPVKSNQPGESCGQLYLKQKEGFLQNIKALVMALTGMPEADIADEAAYDLVADEQPLKGMVVEMDAFMRTSKKTGKDYTVIVWRRVSRAEYMAAVETYGFTYKLPVNACFWEELEAAAAELTETTG